MNDDELLACIETSGMALAALHQGEYEEAIRLYEQINLQTFLPVNQSFLARAYVQAGRVCDAIETLKKAVRLASDDAELAQELETLEERAAEFLLRYLVASIADGCDPSWCQSILDRNMPLVDEEFFTVVLANGMHCAEIRNARILVPLAFISEIVAGRLEIPILQARALQLNGLSANLSGDYPQSLLLLRRAATAFDSEDTRAEQAVCLAQLGIAAMHTAHFDEAVTAYTKAIEYFKCAGDARKMALTLENLADVFREQSDPGRAVEIALEAERQYEALGDEAMALKAMTLRGKCLSRMGRRNEAIAVLQEAIARGRPLWTELPFPLTLANALFSLSYLLADLNHLQESAELRHEATEIYNRLGLAPPELISNITVEAGVNDFDTAVEATKRNIAQLEAAGMIVSAAREKMNLAQVYSQHLRLVTGPGIDADAATIDNVRILYFQSLEMIEEAIAVFREHNAPGFLLFALARRATIIATWAMATEDDTSRDNALNMIDAIIEDTETLGYRGLTASLRQNRAMLLMSMGRLDEAADTLESIETSVLERDDSGLLLSLTATLARLLAKQGKEKEARREFLKMVELYEKLEESVGNVEWTVSWSKGSIAGAFDDAVEYLVSIGDIITAYDLVQQAKGRTFRKALAATSR